MYSSLYDRTALKTVSIFVMPVIAVNTKSKLDIIKLFALCGYVSAVHVYVRVDDFSVLRVLFKCIRK